ncbi:hypothetical protein M0R45_000687 [Rubus argutus]|uniref:Uncharacterized protein n=1 Tax=Rubus argutus TaxID=59490 RepID=A0AAW1VNM2_RUBAR
MATDRRPAKPKRPAPSSEQMTARVFLYSILLALQSRSSASHLQRFIILRSIITATLYIFDIGAEAINSTSGGALLVDYCSCSSKFWGRLPGKGLVVAIRPYIDFNGNYSCVGCLCSFRLGILFVSMGFQG